VFFVVVAFAVCMFVGCSGGGNPGGGGGSSSIVGIWHYSSRGYSAVWEFNADGTFRDCRYQDGILINCRYLEWEATDNSFCIIEVQPFTMDCEAYVLRNNGNTLSTGWEMQRVARNPYE